MALRRNSGLFHSKIHEEKMRSEQNHKQSKPVGRPLDHFLIQFGIHSFDRGLKGVYIQDNKYYLISKSIQNILQRTKKPFSVGIYLGKARGKQFFPSVNLLSMIRSPARNKVWVDDKAAWLFVCGRDLFSEGIKTSTKCVYKGIITLVLNKNDEVLGFGKTLKKLTEKEGVIIQNIFDIGDFLRRERKERRSSKMKNRKN